MAERHRADAARARPVGDQPPPRLAGARLQVAARRGRVPDQRRVRDAARAAERRDPGGLGRALRPERVVDGDRRNAAARTGCRSVQQQEQRDRVTAARDRDPDLARRRRVQRGAQRGRGYGQFSPCRLIATSPATTDPG
jgi:hypothetical protein